MDLLKLLSFIFLGLYLFIVGLHGIGIAVAFIPSAIVGLIGLVAGVLFLVRGIKGCCCKSCVDK